MGLIQQCLASEHFFSIFKTYTNHNDARKQYTQQNRIHKQHMQKIL